MSEQKPMPRGRTFLAGKVISNYGQSTIDCTVRRISDTGAVIEVESVLGVPEHFHLLIPGEGEPQPCKRSWQSEKQIGLVFETVEAVKAEGAQAGPDEAKGADQIMRSQMLALRAALDVMDVGVSAARRQPEIPVHQPRFPPHVGVAGRGRRPQSGLRGADVSWPRHQGV